MALIDLIFVIFILYLLYKLVFGLILPVSKAATSVRDQMRNMQNMQNPPPNHQNNNPAPANAKASGGKTKFVNDSEYIDFEEMK